MEPDEVASKVIAAIRANRYYIFSHTEFKDELRELFVEIIDAFPDEKPNGPRLKFEVGQRENYKKARREARGER